MSNKAPLANWYSEPLKVGDLVVVEIEGMTDYGVNCILVEYCNVKGFISFSEVSKKRVRNVGAVIKIGKQYVTEVVCIDGEYIDLSRKRVYVDDDDMKWNQYKRAKSLMTLLWSSVGMNQEKFLTHLEHIRPLFEMGEDGEDRSSLKCDERLPPKFVDLYNQYHNVQHKYSMVVSVKSYLGGIDAIKRALKYGVEKLNHECGDDAASISLISSPRYLLTVTSSSLKKGNVVKIFSSVVAEIKDKLGQGEFDIVETDNLIRIDGNENNIMDDASDNSKSDDEFGNSGDWSESTVDE